MKMPIIFLYSVAFIASCGHAVHSHRSSTTTNTENSSNSMTQNSANTDTCTTWECTERHKNQNAIIEGFFQKYTPNSTGKGANHMFWDWEIVLSDSVKIPVGSANETIDYRHFEGKRVVINGFVFYGIIIGSDEEQNATGFRIDPEEISALKD